MSTDIGPADGVVTVTLPASCRGVTIANVLGRLVEVSLLLTPSA
jgi:hypothetical protein